MTIDDVVVRGHYGCIYCADRTTLSWASNFVGQGAVHSGTAVRAAIIDGHHDLGGSKEGGGKEDEYHEERHVAGAELV